MSFDRSSLFTCAWVVSLQLMAAGCVTEAAPTEDVAAGDEALFARAPKVPDALQVPAGNKLAFAADADGVQIYVCKAGADGAAAWTLQAPEAKLYGWFGIVIGKHYLGPTWEVLDGSTVVGTKLAAATPDATAIPWLLLQGTSHTGHGALSKITYVQRLETSAGLAPTKGCDSAHLDETHRSAYSATYYFYRASHVAAQGPSTPTPR
jgi:Protein of unknown function (DUF3455)